MPKGNEDQTVTATIEATNQSDDFSRAQVVTPRKNVWISFYKSLVDQMKLHENLIKMLQCNEFETLEDMKRFLTSETIKVTSSGNEVINALMKGSVAIQLNEYDESCLLIPLPLDTKRDVAMPEIEFTVLGPKEAFIEGIDSNIQLIRKKLPVPELKVKELTVGTLSKTRVAIMYIDTIANTENVNTMIQRIGDIQFDEILDSSFIKQMIEDQVWSPFPKFIETERPDRVASGLAEGKVIVIVDGSPQAFLGPSILIEFFSTEEDYFMGWQVSTVFRILRLFAIWFSLFATPLYVAFLTYHVELIPQDLLATIVLSRNQIPFPPVLETLFLELTIELLREAGARLPTKVGQTIGIVGGIVIGTASVEAGLTSNVLLIIVALAALASFTTPIYRIGNTIRLLRFPFIIAAQLWGLISLTLLFCFMLIHLLASTSLGRPYLAPLYPPTLADFKDTFIRLPFSYQSKQPKILLTKKKIRFNGNNAKKKHDIDE
ncbi:spore germination protein [bacterium LRH843]|nr:spore germination protein [bacterium LRH843]